MVFLIFFILFGSFNFLYSNEIKEKHILEFVETDNDLLNFYRETSKNVNVSQEEIDIYKKKLIFFENFLNKKTNLNDEEIKNKIILIKENLLNEEASGVKKSIDEIFKNNVSSEGSFSYLKNQSNFNINNETLIEKQKIIENLKNSNKIEEIKKLIKEYKKLDLNTENNIKEAFDKNKKGKKSLFRFLNIIFYFSTISAFTNSFCLDDPKYNVFMKNTSSQGVNENVKNYVNNSYVNNFSIFFQTIKKIFHDKQKFKKMQDKYVENHENFNDAENKQKIEEIEKFKERISENSYYDKIFYFIF